MRYVIVDADGLIGLSNEDDAHFSRAVDIVRKLQKKDVELIFPSTTIAEATAVLQVRLKKQHSVNKIFESIKLGMYHIQEVDQKLVEKGISFVEDGKTTHGTLFDGIVAAVAEKYNADAIFSFDKLYKSKGFKLASEL